MEPPHGAATDQSDPQGASDAAHIQRFARDCTGKKCLPNRKASGRLEVAFLANVH
jgi:hypothetical protein